MSHFLNDVLANGDANVCQQTVNNSFQSKFFMLFMFMIFYHGKYFLFLYKKNQFLEIPWCYGDLTWMLNGTLRFTG